MSSDCQNPIACKLYNQIINLVPSSFKTNYFLANIDICVEQVTGELSAKKEEVAMTAHG